MNDNRNDSNYATRMAIILVVGIAVCVAMIVLASLHKHIPYASPWKH